MKSALLFWGPVSYNQRIKAH